MREEELLRRRRYLVAHHARVKKGGHLSQSEGGQKVGGERRLWEPGGTTSSECEGAEGERGAEVVGGGDCMREDGTWRDNQVRVRGGSRGEESRHRGGCGPLQTRPEVRRVDPANGCGRRGLRAVLACGLRVVPVGTNRGLRAVLPLSSHYCPLSL